MELKLTKEDLSSLAELLVSADEWDEDALEPLIDGGSIESCTLSESNNPDFVIIGTFVTTVGVFDLSVALGCAGTAFVSLELEGYGGFNYDASDSIPGFQEYIDALRDKNA